MLSFPILSFFSICAGRLHNLLLHLLRCPHNGTKAMPVIIHRISYHDLNDSATPKTHKNSGQPGLWTVLIFIGIQLYRAGKLISSPHIPAFTDLFSPILTPPVPGTLPPLPCIPPRPTVPPLSRLPCRKYPFPCRSLSESRPTDR